MEQKQSFLDFLNKKGFIPKWRLLVVDFAINFIFFAILFLIIHRKDSGLYLITTFSAVFALVFWSYAQSILICSKLAYLHHLICLLLPYSIMMVDMLNSQWKNKAYFLSQYFVYFSLGCVFISIDMLMRDSTFSKSLVCKIIHVCWNVFCSILFFIFIILSLNSVLGNASFDYDAIVAVCQTNFSEALGYMSRLNHQYLLLISAGILAIGLIFLNVILIYKKQCNTKRLLSVTCMIIPITVLAIVLIGFHTRFYYSNVFKLMWSPVSYYQENKKFKQERANYEAFIQKRLSNEPRNADSSGIFVIIIGESLNRHYMSAYGYPKETSPFQQKMVNEKKFYQFKNVYSAYAQTIRCIAYMLTNQNQYDNQEIGLRDSISLFDIARHNDFSTRWFSAQGVNLLLDSPTAVISNSAENSFSLPMVRGKIDHKVTDMDMLDFLPDKLSEKEFIVIQLIGSHYPYDQVYPADYMKDSDFSDYEKSVSYNDQVIEKLFSFFTERNASAILYLSDHSEDVASGRGHDPRIEVFTQVMTEIPFWIYISPEYASKHSQLSMQLQRATERIFTSDLFFDLVIFLMNIQSTFTDSSKNILSDDYFLTEENARTLGGKVKLKIHVSPGK
ncbi:MAG: phosphoethanolamine transferase [Victivallales bacterium]|nr:phosphoethanolamine transferase [Victivallales bacterium]